MPKKEKTQMKITEKKVVTIIQVEVEFNEFFDGLSNLIADVQADRYLEDHIPTRELLKKMDAGKLTIEQARNSFQDCHLDLLYSATLRYLAKQNGYRVNNYGIYDRFIKCITCSFVRDGEHI